MVHHSIYIKGKGYWVFLVPIATACVLFTVCSVTGLNDKYVRPVTLLISSFILWFMDGGPAALKDGIDIQHQKGKNSRLWLEVKYWALLRGIIGCVLLGILLN
ncbi:MAG: hypothetical protein ACXVAY_07840 [Mucilaginibacter sp.]